MAEVEARLDRMEQAIQSLAGITGELAREVRGLAQGLASDRAMFRETLRELSGFVATAGLELERVGRRIERLAEVTEVGFTRLELSIAENNREITDNNRHITENNRQLIENNRLIAENHRQLIENNRLIAENSAAIRRLLDFLTRGRGNGEGPPA
jgi:hypothetical protein